MGKDDQEPGKSEPLVSVQSPSQTLLERLKKLRKWQENQREALEQVQLHGPVTPSISHQSQQLEELTMNLDYECQTTKDSVYSHHKTCEKKYPHQETMSIIQTELDTPSNSMPFNVPHEVNLGGSLSKERVADWSVSKSKVSQDRVNSSQNNSYIEKAAATWPPQRSKQNSDISNPMILRDSPEYEKSKSQPCCTDSSNEVGDKKSLTDNILNNSRNPSVSVDNMESRKVKKPQVFSSSQDDFNNCSNNSFEKKISEKTENEIYHSEKYESGPPRLKSSFPEKKNIDTNKSAFLTQHAIPKPKCKYLRKGEGTARFGMKAIKLKKMKVPLGNKKLRNTIMTSVHSKFQSESSVRINVKRPVSRLDIKKAPSTAIPKSGNIVDGSADHTATSAVNGSKTSLQKSLHLEYPQKPCVSDVEFEKQSLKELEELSAFEKLEELAADSSFSSNSSTVWQLLQHGQQSAASTPLKQPSFTVQDTSAFKYYNQQRPILKKGETESTTGNRMLDAHVDIEDSSSDCQQSVLSVSQVLNHLRAIFRLEDADVIGMSEADMKKKLDILADEQASLSPETVSHFASGMWNVPANSTSTPAHLQTLTQPKPHVHFRSEGVEVIEYELSESDGDDTLTDAPSITGEDSDLVTTSEMEALALLNICGPAVQSQVITSDNENKQYGECYEEGDSKICSSESVASDQVTSRESGLEKGIQPIALQFSPPQHPKHTSSDYIWSIFGKERHLRKMSKTKVSDMTEKNKSDYTKHSHKSDHNENEVDVASRKLQEQAVTKNEVETYKALLLAKICELEKETKIFKKENSKLQNLQQLVQEERTQLGDEKQKLQEEIAKEKKRLQEYTDRERNNIWKEKQELKKLTPSITEAKEHSLEIVYLKEKIHDLQEEAKKKASMHQFSIKKLNEKLRVLEEENRQLKNKNSTLQNLEKENMQLKHKLDRTKLNKKQVLVDQVGNVAKGKHRPTIDSISRSLNRNARSEIKGTVSFDGKPSVLMARHIDNGQNVELCNTELTSVVDEEVKISMKDKVLTSLENVEKTCKENYVSEKGTEVAYQQQGNVLEDDRQYVNMKESHNVLEPRNILKSLDEKSVEFTEICRDDGTKEIIYANGNKKEVYMNGLVIVSYYNGDRKEIHEDRTVYVYGTDLTSHTTFNDGKEVLVFPNGQKETRLPDGSSEIVFTDSSRKIVLKDGTETCFMKNGTIVRSNPDGSKVFEFVSGQREIHTDGEKRREYPDGTVKILHQDGRTETRYKTGRTRIKDCKGNIILDTYQGVS
ncbi:uncharacterized protein [Panulirus ornatus]|uniref:uncharacterized protein n=1 Tax=Panulirus ornatus TaxID=150431 RepID=UPI003A87D321